MTQTINPRILYSQSPFFLDFIEGTRAASELFEHSITSAHRLGEARQTYLSQHIRSEICDALFEYNRTLDASPGTMGNIERLRDPKALCVIGGQQVGFLGGPLFVIYKIVSIIRTAAWLSDYLSVPVLPVFWLASEDHDFAEINHTRWLDDSGSIRTISFNWNGQGRPIEKLPMIEAAQRAFDEVSQKIPFSKASDADIFSSVEDDTYCTWHARMWTRLFSHDGLIIVEPRVLRPLAKPFFVRALSEPNVIQAALAQSASQLERRGYPVPLDPSRSGKLFGFTESGIRQRIHESPNELNLSEPITYSADAALRPLLADSLLPTIANILGPSELAYHAMLHPLYQQWEIPQPLAIPRQGATVISKADFELLGGLGIEISEALRPEFNPADIAKRMASDKLATEFATAQERLERALLPLRDHLIKIDPGLEARWRQSADQAAHQVERLKERAIRVELSQRGVSVKNAQRLKPFLRPMGKAQERILSAFSFVARFGVEWIHKMIARGEPDRFEHQLIVLKEPHE